MLEILQILSHVLQIVMSSIIISNSKIKLLYCWSATNHFLPNQKNFFFFDMSGYKAMC